MGRASTGRLRSALARIADARAGGYGLLVEQRSEPGDGWSAADDLVRDDGPLDGMVAAVARSAGIDHPPLGAEWLLEHHAWQGASLTAAAMMSGWVPDLEPGNVLVKFKDGAIWGIALRGGAVREVRGEEALARAGHDALVAHVSPLLDALAARRLRAARALWRGAGDRVGQAFLWCAEAFGDPARAARLATLDDRAAVAAACPAADGLRRRRHAVSRARELLSLPPGSRGRALRRLPAPPLAAGASRRGLLELAQVGLELPQVLFLVAEDVDHGVTV